MLTGHGHDYMKAVVSRVAQLVEQQIANRLTLESKRCVYDTRSSSKTLLCGSPAQERCWSTTCAHLIGHEIRCTIIQLCRKEPALWQVMSGTIIQLCAKRTCHWEDHPSSSSCPGSDEDTT